MQASRIPDPVWLPGPGLWQCQGCGDESTSRLAAAECCDPAWEPPRERTARTHDHPSD